MDMSLTKPVSAETTPSGLIRVLIRNTCCCSAAPPPCGGAICGDFALSTPEAVNWLEIERGCAPSRSRAVSDIRVLILLLRSRIQQAGAQGLAEMLTQLAELERNLV